MTNNHPDAKIPYIVKVPQPLRSQSAFGCRNCLWKGVECVDGWNYKAGRPLMDFPKDSGCQGYTYYD